MENVIIMSGCKPDNDRKGVLLMKYIITGRNIEVTPRLRNIVETKLGKLERYFNQDTEVHATLSSEKDRQTIEVTIPVKGSIIRSEQTSDDIVVSIDLVEEIIERQLKRYKTRLQDKYQSGGGFSETLFEEPADDDFDIRIEKTKSFAVKPMDPEEACMQMDLLGHDFFVFTNSETDQTNVVYKRKNDTYGIIEPEY